MVRKENKTINIDGWPSPTTEHKIEQPELNVGYYGNDLFNIIDIEDFIENANFTLF